MKKGIIFMLLSIIAISVSAQTQVFVGPAVGIGINKFKVNGGLGDDNYSTDAKIGLNVGVPFEIRFNDIIALEPGIFYSSRGGDDFGSRFNIHQIEIPLIAKIGYGQNDTWQVYGIAGFKLGVGIKANIKDSFDNKYDLDYGTNDGELKRGYFGMELGVGGGYKIGPGKIVANLTYDIAMTKLSRGNFSIAGDPTVRQRNLNFNVGYLFQLGGK